MFLDLSHPIDNQTPVYPGDPHVTIDKVQDINHTSSYTLHTVSLGSHSGTHIDAPSHMIAGGANINDLNLTSFCGNGLCFDAKNEFSVDTLRAFEISENSIVLFNTGSYAHFHEPDYFKVYPVMGLEVAEFLLEKKVKLVGLDTCSADNAPDFPIHKLLLGNGIPIIENLTNLDAITGKNFRVYAFPINIIADGAQARVVAEMDL